jgi:hypothetical protein
MAIGRRNLSLLSLKKALISFEKIHKQKYDQRSRGILHEK